MKLVLEDGSELEGQGFGADIAVEGEVVFNTGMSGYIESLTDPSYKGQILVLTHPLVGNYGVPANRGSHSLSPPFESNQIQVQGLVVQNYIEQYSHHSAGQSLGAWLSEGDTPGLSGIDTRTLTRKLRENGTMRGWIFPSRHETGEAKQLARSVDMNSDVFYRAAPSETHRYQGGESTILLIDVGAKDNIVRSLLKRKVNVIRAPWHTDILALANDADGILIGSGPGDPKNLQPLVENLRTLLATYTKPIFGICLGHQLLSLAAGGDTFKLPYGHRSVNQPVQDLITRRCFITSQNHGYAVKDDSLPDSWEPWFVNINDGTNEGVRSLNKPFFSVQFHPECHPGPSDTDYLFDHFISAVQAIKRS